MRESQETGPGQKWNPVRLRPIKPGDDRHAVRAHGDQLVIHYPNAGLRREGEREDFASGNVPGVIGFGELGQSEAAIGQGDCGFRASATQR